MAEVFHDDNLGENVKRSPGIVRESEFRDEHLYKTFLLKDKNRIKNQKTNARRNALRRQNGKKTRRGSKGRRFYIGAEEIQYSKECNDIKYRITEKIDTLLVNGNIVKLFELYGVEMKERYDNYFGICPFHPELTPSFVLSKSKCLCFCFGCAHPRGPILYTLFILKFGENVRKTLVKRKELEVDIDKYMPLSPTNKNPGIRKTSPVYINSVSCDAPGRAFHEEVPPASGNNVDEHDIIDPADRDLPF